MINVAELMGDPDFVEEIVLKRPTGAFDDTGVWANTYAEDETITAIVQPASAFDAKMLPEGTRLDNSIVIWTENATALTAGNGTDAEADVVVWNEQSYRVKSIEPWPGGGYTMAIAEGFAAGAVPEPAP